MASGETHPPRKNGDVPHSLDRECEDGRFSPAPIAR
jgi:hypothetical protein